LKTNNFHFHSLESVTELHKFSKAMGKKGVVGKVKAGKTSTN